MYNQSTASYQDSQLQRSYQPGSLQQSKVQPSSGLNSVFQQNILPQNGANQKARNLLQTQLGSPMQRNKPNLQGSIYDIQKSQSGMKQQSQISLQKVDSREIGSEQYLDDNQMNQNSNQDREYRPLNLGEIMKYTNKKNNKQIKGQSIIELIHDEQDISTKKYTLKNKELSILKTSFTDNIFPPNESSLGDIVQSKILGSQVSWVRLSNLYNKGQLLPIKTQYNSLTTGITQSDNLFCIFCILIRNMHLVERILENKVISDSGLYCVWLFLNGSWKNILIDDYIPVKTIEPVSMVFSSIDDMKNNLWIAILEKALAKAYHSYSNLHPYEVHSTLVDITGAPYFLMKKREPSPQSQQQQQSKQKSVDSTEKSYWWSKIKNGIQKNYIITAKCYLSDKGVIAQQTYFIIESKEFKLEFGNEIQILKLWNCRQNQQVENQVNMSNLTQEQMNELSDKSEGMFYISLDELYKKFDQIAIIRIEANDYQNSIKVQQKPDSIFRSQEISQSSVVRMKITGEVSGYLSVCQKGIQSCRKLNYTYSQFSLILSQVLENGSLKYISQTFSNEKIIHFPFNLQDGIYAIHIEARWKQSIHRKFRISLSSDKQIGLQVYENNEQNKLHSDTVLKLIAKNYIEQYGQEFKQENTKLQGKKGQFGAFYLYYLKNITQKYILKQTIDVIDISNYEFFDTSILENKQIKFSLFPNEEIVLLFRILQTQRASKIKLQFQQGSKVIYEGNTLEARCQQTLTACTEYIDIYNEFALIPDRKQNFMNENFYEQNQENSEEEESSEQIVSVEQKQEINQVVVYDKYLNGTYQIIHLSTAIINFLILLFIIIASILRCLEYDVFVYSMIYYQMICRKMKTSYLKTFIFLQCLTIIYDITYIKLYNFNHATSYTIVLKNNGIYSFILSFSKFTWVILLFLKVIFTFMMVRVFATKKEELKYYYKSYQDTLVKITSKLERQEQNNISTQQQLQQP